MEKTVSEDHLLCPICLELPRGNIFQCQNGHHICEKCLQPLKTCPQCRIRYGIRKIRNRALETLLDSMRFDCTYKGEGCPTKPLRPELTNHENNCDFKPFSICKFIGFNNCEFICPKIPQLTIAHLQQTHGIVTHQQGTELNIAYEHFGTTSSSTTPNNPGNNTARWEPFLWKLEKDNYGPTFLFLFAKTMMSQEEGEDAAAAGPVVTCSWLSLFMGNCKKEAAKFKVEYSIPKVFQKDKAFQLKWEQSPTPFTNIPKISEYYFSGISNLPFSFFAQYYNKNIIKTHTKTGDSDNDGVNNNFEDDDSLLVHVKISSGTKKLAEGHVDTTLHLMRV